MRLSRLRRRDGMRVIPFEVRDCEIDGLVMHGLLKTADRNDRGAIARALGNLIDRLPPERWAPTPDKPGRVTLDLTPEFIDHLANLGWLAFATRRDKDAVSTGFLGFAKRAFTLSERAAHLFRADRYS
jgi:hypothetical protein